jgi:hypothetical protein
MRSQTSFSRFSDLYGFDGILDWSTISGDRESVCLPGSPWNNRPSGEKVLTPLSNPQVKTGYAAFQQRYTDRILIWSKT